MIVILKKTTLNQKKHLAQRRPRAQRPEWEIGWNRNEGSIPFTRSIDTEALTKYVARM
jgi:hypothetical protein